MGAGGCAETPKLYYVIYEQPLIVNNFLRGWRGELFSLMEAIMASVKNKLTIDRLNDRLTKYYDCKLGLPGQDCQRKCSEEEKCKKKSSASLGAHSYR